jgi:hypothetical protein
MAKRSYLQYVMITFVDITIVVIIKKRNKL